MIALSWLLLTLGAAPSEVAAPPETPRVVAALRAAGLDPTTQLQGDGVQVMWGQRAVITLDQAGRPALIAVEQGRIDRAAPPGAIDLLKGVRPGRLGVAVDADPEQRKSMMKVWNALQRPIAFEAELIALRSGQLMRRRVAVCAVAAGATALETWSEPILAVVVSNFYEPSADAPACAQENDSWPST